MRLVNPRNSIPTALALRPGDLASATGRCPDENSLAEYLDGPCDGQNKEEVEGHLAVCPRCCYLVQLLSTEELKAG